MNIIYRIRARMGETEMNRKGEAPSKKTDAALRQVFAEIREEVGRVIVDRLRALSRETWTREIEPEEHGGAATEEVPFGLADAADDIEQWINGHGWSTAPAVEDDRKNDCACMVSGCPDPGVCLLVGRAVCRAHYDRLERAFSDR